MRLPLLISLSISLLLLSWSKAGFLVPAVGELSSLVNISPLPSVSGRGALPGRGGYGVVVSGSIGVSSHTLSSSAAGSPR